MKVLFAVSNENISTQIVKKYQREYKEIISYKNMYYFNAIVKELQRDKTYDRIVIGEDLEPFSSNNYEAIDKFIFDKLDSISDEATGSEGDIPIILLCADRRAKSEPILVKIFGLGIYNALLTPDKSLDNVCKLLNKPRSKKEAKTYYRIDSEEVNYQSENEDSVSEIEIQNILKHYKRLGRDEEKYVQSFNNIAAQYNDAQLRIITKFLPLNVKAVLEERSPKYQSVMTFGETLSTANATNNEKKKNAEGLKVDFLGKNAGGKLAKPVIVPTAVNRNVKKIETNKTKTNNRVNIPDEKIERKQNLESFYDNTKTERNIELNNSSNEVENDDLFDFVTTEQTVKDIKPKRGRPRKNPIDNMEENGKNQNTKPKRGRPRKSIEKEEILPGFDDIKERKDNEDILKDSRNITQKESFSKFNEEESTLPGFDEIEESTLPGFDEIEESILPDFDEVDHEEESTLPGFDEIEESTLPGFDETNDEENITSNFNEQKNYSYSPNSYNNASTWDNNNASNITSYSGDNYYSNSANRVNNLLSKDKKVVSFVGTSKNGTSFLVNNLAKTTASMGIKTAILDLTANRNSYYIFTNNDEKLRGIAYESIKKLRSGIASGISVDRNLDVYTALPGDNIPIDDAENILATLVQNYSLVIMDCDFTTPVSYFGIAQEIYIVQTLDILTIQPMTAFLRELKAKDVLKEEKIRVIINKEVRIKGLTPNAIIGGLAFYNDPAMSFMTELFNKERVKHITIPFDEETYIRYLENVMECEISTSGYSKELISKIKELANMVYPLIGNKYTSQSNYSYSGNNFSNNMNSTLEKMKRNY